MSTIKPDCNLCDTPCYSCWLDETEDESMSDAIFWPDSWHDDEDWPEFDDEGDYDLLDSELQDSWIPEHLYGYPDIDDVWRVF